MDDWVPCLYYYYKVKWIISKTMVIDFGSRSGSWLWRAMLMLLTIWRSISNSISIKTTGCFLPITQQYHYSHIVTSIIKTLPNRQAINIWFFLTLFKSTHFSGPRRYFISNIGNIKLQCINMEGDDEVISTVEKAGIL